MPRKVVTREIYKGSGLFFSNELTTFGGKVDILRRLVKQYLERFFDNRTWMPLDSKLFSETKSSKIQHAETFDAKVLTINKSISTLL